MPGRIPLKACRSSAPDGTCLEAARGRRWPGGTAGVSLTAPPAASASLRPYVLRWGWEELSPSHGTIPAPWPGSIHSKSEPSDPGLEPTSCPLHLASWSWSTRWRRGSQPFQVHPRKCKPKENKTKQSGCLIENNKRNWKSTHCGKIWHLSLPSPQPC